MHAALSAEPINPSPVAKVNQLMRKGVAAHVDAKRKERRTIHAVADGSCVADGRRFYRRRAMAGKLAPGV